MKNIYTLTCNDGLTDSFTFKQPYSSNKAAQGSLDALKKHLIKKHNLVDPKEVLWSFNTGGDNITIILQDRWNLTIVKEEVNKEVSTFEFS